MNKREHNIAEHVKTCMTAASSVEFMNHKDMVSKLGDVITVKYYDDANPKWSRNIFPKWNTIFTFNLKNNTYCLDNCGYNTKMTVTRMNTVLNAINSNMAVCVKNGVFTIIDMKSRNETPCPDGVFRGKLNVTK